MVLRFVGNEEQSVRSGRWTDTKKWASPGRFPGEARFFLAPFDFAGGALTPGLILYQNPHWRVTMT